MSARSSKISRRKSKLVSIIKMTQQHISLPYLVLIFSGLCINGEFLVQAKKKKKKKRVMMALNRSVEFKSSNPKPSAAECFGT